MTATLITEHRYRPEGACAELFERRDPEVLVSGPAGTGKSRACLEKLHLMALLNPGMRGLIVRKTAVSLTSTALVTWRNFVVKEALATGLVTYYGGSGEEPAQYRYNNGSTIMVCGMDKSTRVMSSEYDLIYVQEAIELTQDDWEALTTRLRNGVVSFQQLIADTNPSTPTHWLKKRCDAGSTALLNSRHEDNPTLFDAGGALSEYGREYIAKLDALTGVRLLRLRKGQWAAAEGMIYADEWNERIHVIDRFDIPEDWTRYWVVDFGYRHPFVCQWWAEDPDGRLYRYREIFHTGRLVEDHARKMLDQVRPDESGPWIEPRPRAVICDHDAEGRATLEKHLGMSTSPAKKSVTDGIQAVQARLRISGDGRPRLYFLRKSLVEVDNELVSINAPTCTEEEIPGYVWADKLKEEPVKEQDDGCDALRYMVAYRDLKSRSRVRFL
jgi:PBSX family phage terminase large subunit